MWRIGGIAFVTLSYIGSAFSIVECELRTAIERGDIHEVKDLLEKVQPLTIEDKQELIKLAQEQIDSKKPVSSWHLPVGLALLGISFISSLASRLEEFRSGEPKLNSNPFKNPPFVGLSDQIRAGFARYEENVKAKDKIASRHQFFLRTVIQIMGIYHVCKHFMQRDTGKEYNQALVIKELIDTYKAEQKKGIDNV